MLRLRRLLPDRCHTPRQRCGLHDGALTNLDVQRIEADEIWSFCYAKQKNVPEEFVGTPGYGDVWTWVAIDADTKLVPSWLVGERTTQDCWVFLSDLKSRIRVGNRIQLTTDGFGSYPPVVDSLWRNAIDYAQIIKDRLRFVLFARWR